MNDLSGQTIKGYELREKIGAGGFGAVYRAHQPIVGREVAIKVILPQYANHPDFIRRFEVEAQLVARLEHMNIVPLYDYWREPDGAYLVMRWLRSGSLRDRIKRGPLSLTEASRLVEQIAAALTVAHRNGVIHRDLKPANILLDEEGNTYLTDFGIAKAPMLPAEMTQEGQVKGSPAYLSPEQIRAEPVTPCTDIYAFGVVIYEALTGQHPFSTDLTPTAMIYKQLQEPLPLLKRAQLGLPATLDDVIQRATAKDPAARYPNALNVASAFRKVVRHATEAAPVDREAGLTPVLDETAVISEETTPLSITPPTISNPYKGLRAFQEADAPDFFGREVLTGRLVARLAEDHPMVRFLAVVGPSGSGKSSVVKAGLIPALRREALSGSDCWFIAEMLPGSHPLDELEVALLRVASKHVPGLAEQLQRDERGLARAAKLILPENGELLLVIDQFEEVFMLAEDTTQARHFLDLIYAAVTEPRSPVRVIITLRADFYDRPLVIPYFSDLVSQRTEVIVPLTATELELAIVGPAEHANVKVEPKLVAEIAGEVGEQPGALPMLQYALTELFERRSDHTLTLDAYQELGGVLGVLALRAGEVYYKLSPEQQSVTRQAFLRLVTLGEGTEDTRRRVKQSELLALGGITSSGPEGKGSEVKIMLDAFGQSRLLTFDRDPQTREPTVEVAHEAIIREWNLLRTWLDESRNDVRQQRMLAAATHEWQSAGKDRSYLLTGTRLAQFEGWSEHTDVALTQDECEFLTVSIVEKRKQQAQRRRVRNLVFVATSISVLIMAVLSLIAFDREQNAQRARAKAERESAVNRSLVFAANAVQAFETGETDLALALALEAVDTDQPSPEAERALSTVALGPGTRMILSGHTHSVDDIAFGPDGHLAVSCSCAQLDSVGVCAQGELILWDITAGEELYRIKGHTGAINSVMFSPDGNMLVSGGDDAVIRLWDVKTGDEIRRFEGHTGAINNVMFSPDGNMLVSGGDDAVIQLWDVKTGDEIRRFEGHTGAINNVMFSPDGNTLVSGGEDAVIRLWDVKTGDEIRRFEGHHARILDLLISPDGQTLLSGADDFTMRAWRMESGDEIHQRVFAGTTNDLAISPDGRIAVLAIGHHTLQLWDIEAWHETQRLTDHTAMVSSVALSPNGQWALSGSTDGTLRLWTLEVQTESRRFEKASILLTSVVTDPGGSRLLTGTGLGDTLLWDIESGKVIRRLEGNEGATDAVFSPDGHYALVSSGDFFGGTDARSLILWDVERGEIVHRLEGHNYYLRSVAISPDGRSALSGSYTPEGEGELILWDLATGKQIRQFDSAEDVTRIDFSADGRRAVTSSAHHRNLMLWDITTGQLIRRFNYTDAILDVLFAPDETTLLAASEDSLITLWDIGTGKIVRRFQGHTGAVWGIDISPDGQYIISSSDNGIIILWSFETGEELRRFQGPQIGVYDIAFSVDGRTAFSSSIDGTLIQWQIADWPLDKLLAWVHENRYIREFTCDERAKYRIEPLCEE